MASGVWVVDGDVGPVRFAPAVGDADSAAGGEASLEAPMPGTVVQLRVEAGATVTAGETLVVMESMKMEISIQSPRDGVGRDRSSSPSATRSTAAPP